MRYVVKRVPDGAYVARPDSLKSYTKYLQDARTYDTPEAAKRDCCENERVVTVESEMR